MSGRARPPASTWRPSPPRRRRASATVSSCVVGDQRAHVGAVGEAGAEPHAPSRARRSAATNSSAMRLVHVQPLDRDAQLPGGGEAARAPRPRPPASGRRRASTIIAFLPPSSIEHADQPLGRLRGDRAAGRGAAGEHDVVGAARSASGPSSAPEPVTTCSTSGGQPGLLEQLDARQRGERGLGVGLQHHGVAGREGRDRVADRQRQRVVPGRDDADDAERVVVLPGAPGEDRESAPAAARRSRCVAPSARSSGRTSVTSRISSKACRRALPDSSWIEVEDLVLASSTRSWKRSSSALALARSRSSPTPPGPRWARRTASSTSSAVHRGTAPSRPPVAGFSIIELVAAGPGHARDPRGQLGVPLGPRRSPPRRDAHRPTLLLALTWMTSRYPAPRDPIARKTITSSWSPSSSSPWERSQSARAWRTGPSEPRWR